MVLASLPCKAPVLTPPQFLLPNFHPLHHSNSSIKISDLIFVCVSSRFVFYIYFFIPCTVTLFFYQQHLLKISSLFFNALTIFFFHIFGHSFYMTVYYFFLFFFSSFIFNFSSNLFLLSTLEFHFQLLIISQYLFQFLS